MINKTNLLALCICLLFACTKDETKGPLEGTQWLDISEGERDYLEFTGNQVLKWDAMEDTSTCQDYDSYDYTIELDSLFIDRVDFHLRVQFELTTDTLYLHQGDLVSRLAKFQFDADTLDICPLTK